MLNIPTKKQLDAYWQHLQSQFPKITEGKSRANLRMEQALFGGEKPYVINMAKVTPKKISQSFMQLM